MVAVDALATATYPLPSTDLSTTNQLHHSMHRDADPLRPVVELIDDLVQRLLQQVGAEQEIDLFARRRQMQRTGACRQIGAQERRAHPTHPEAGRGFQRGDVFRTDDGALSLAEDDGVRCVVERAEHARYIAEGAALDAALAERPGGLAFEVDDDEVGAGVKDLSEVIVAVRADTQPADPGAENIADAGLRLRFTIQQLDYAQDVSAPAQELERLRGLGADELIDRALIVRSER